MEGTDAEPRWLDDHEQAAWRALIVGSQLLMDQLDRDLRGRHGISFAEYEILVRLSEAETGALRMAQLADSVQHLRSRVTHTVSRMERAGLVRRASVAEDGRGVEAAMTPAGRALIEEAAPTHVGGVRTYLFDLASEVEYSALGDLFNRVSDLLLTGKPAIADIRPTART